MIVTMAFNHMHTPLESTSKFLSLVLRHKPDAIGLKLDAEGWADLDQLLELANAKGTALTHDVVLEIVATSDKKRFALSPDGKRIRANQGHSVAVDLNLIPKEPPAILFHGTATRFAQSIREKGLMPGARQHVHLSLAATTAAEVGSRHGKPLVLVVRASDMHRDGFKFFLSDNGVWLTASVPTRYLEFPAETYTA
jgi:putative RNA 2'-phosphotransferase